MMKFNHLKLLGLSLICFFGMIQFSIAQVSPDAGKTLFKNYCASCHAKDMRSAATGPALGGAQERWGDDVALYAWIRNSQKSIADGYPRAVELWNEYKPTVMTAYPDLTDDEIGSILAFVNGTYDGTYGVAANVVVATDDQVGDKGPNKYLYWLLFGVLGVLALVLARIINNLNKISAAKEGRIYEERTLWQSLTSKGMISFLIFALVVLGGYTMVNNATNLSRQEGYKPEQPIKFSHETHAGVHQIDCQYCHDGARRSKHSVIPAANTCMNCHRAIKTGSQYGTAEITKIFASIGYNPKSNTYISNYNDYPQDSIKKVYTDWIKENYVNDNDLAELDVKGKKVVEDQWNDIVSSLTNNVKKQIQGPIEWTRVHNLPDHVYFNHAQHVEVGKVECETCHGNVDEMEVVSQEAPLSMGWCVNCHRQTAVQFNDNEYYKSYEKYHEEMASGKREKVTVSDIGGLECQKCHY